MKVKWGGRQNWLGPSGQLFNTKPLDPERCTEHHANLLTTGVAAQDKRATYFVIFCKGIRDFAKESSPWLGFLEEVNDIMNESLVRVGFC